MGCDELLDDFENLLFDFGWGQEMGQFLSHDLEQYLCFLFKSSQEQHFLHA